MFFWEGMAAKAQVPPPASHRPDVTPGVVLQIVYGEKLPAGE